MTRCITRKSFSKFNVSHSPWSVLNFRGQIFENFKTLIDMAIICLEWPFVSFSIDTFQILGLPVLEHVLTPRTRATEVYCTFCTLLVIRDFFIFFQP